ncbi:MAG TPA: hypothetical protein VF713_05385, partial [Thermoanaerobaculia bacterium]
LVGAAWLLPQIAPDGWRSTLAAVCSALPLWTLIDPSGKTSSPERLDLMTTLLLAAGLGVAALILAWVMSRDKTSVRQSSA